jgi:hypothetical protein
MLINHLNLIFGVVVVVVVVVVVGKVHQVLVVIGSYQFENKYPMIYEHCLDFVAMIRKLLQYKMLMNRL